MKDFVKRWLLPPGVTDLLGPGSRMASKKPLVPPEVAANAAFRGIHAGERCFIVANGPSINGQDLTLLRGEHVFSVSSGYHHSHYRLVQPRYHFVPQISYGRISEQDVIRWFEEMHDGIGSAELFLSWSEAPLVEQGKLFPGRKVHYLWLRENMDRIPRNQLIDLARPVPGVQSVTIMCLMAALHFGYGEIYLLGVEHDHFLTQRYNYFYEPTVLKSKDQATDADGNMQVCRHDQFQALALLWRQYRVIREIAGNLGVSIINATDGGELDEFPRVRFESLFKARACGVGA